MKITVSGTGTKALAQLGRRIARLASAETRQRVAKVMGHEALFRVLSCFEQSKDPYGLPWAPLKHRAGMPLLDTGRLRNSLHVSTTPQGVTVHTSVKYAALHNYGGVVRAKNKKALAFKVGNRTVFAKSVTIPARPFFPSDKRALPIMWDRGFREVATEFLRRELGNARRGAR